MDNEAYNDAKSELNLMRNQQNLYQEKVKLAREHVKRRTDAAIEMYEPMVKARDSSLKLTHSYDDRLKNRELVKKAKDSAIKRHKGKLKIQTERGGENYFDLGDNIVNIKDKGRNVPSSVLHELGHAENARKLGIDEAIRKKESFYTPEPLSNSSIGERVSNVRNIAANRINQLTEEASASYRASAQARKLGATPEEQRRIRLELNDSFDTYRKEAASMLKLRQQGIKARKK